MAIKIKIKCGLCKEYFIHNNANKKYCPKCTPKMSKRD